MFVWYQIYFQNALSVIIRSKIDTWWATWWKLIPGERPGNFGELWHPGEHVHLRQRVLCTDSPFDTDKTDGNGVHLVWNTYLLTQVISLLLEVTARILSDLEGSDVPVVAEKEDDKLGLISDWNQLNLEQYQQIKKWQKEPKIASSSYKTSKRCQKYHEEP